VVRLITRLASALICFIVWPVWYAALMARDFYVGVRWVFPGWTLDREDAHNTTLLRDAKNPPFLDKLRG
jgi:hypothetical protein